MTYLSRHRERHNVRGIFNQRCGVPSCFARPWNGGFPGDESLRNFVMQSVPTSGWQFACPAARLARPHPLPFPLSFHLQPNPFPRCKLNCTQNIRLPSLPFPRETRVQPRILSPCSPPTVSSSRIRLWIRPSAAGRKAVPRLISSDLKRERRPNVRYLNRFVRFLTRNKYSNIYRISRFFRESCI